MTAYGYIRTSRDQEPGHPGSDPHVQRRQLIGAGVDAGHIYADVAASGAKEVRRVQIHAPQRPGPDGVKLTRPTSDRYHFALSLHMVVSPAS